MTSTAHDPGGDDVDGFPFERLLAFLRSLPDVGVDQVLSVHELLVRLAERGELPATLLQLRPMLSPIVCKSASEQLAFADAYREFCAASQGERASVPSPSPGPTITQVLLSRRRWKWATMALATMLVLTTLRLQLEPSPVEAPRPVASSSSGQGRGKSLPQNFATSPLSPPLAEPVIPKEVVERFELRRDALRVGPILPTPRQIHLAAIYALLAGVAMALIVRWSWMAWEARRILARDPASKMATVSQLALSIPESLEDDPALRMLATILRRPEPLASTDVDVAATVRATARAGGRVIPVLKPRRRTPEYVALLERRHAGDVQCRLFDSWLDRLSAQDVHLQRFYFDRDPRVVLPGRRGQAPRSLDELLSQTLDHRLLVFSDGHTLLDPMRGEPKASALALSGWTRRVLVTPEPEACWGSVETALAEIGLTPVPATAVGLAVSREVDRADSMMLSEAEGAPFPLPSAMRENARRWLRDDQPDSTEVEQLLALLQLYLGPYGYDWLAACALYPQLRVELCGALGHELNRSDPTRPYTRLLLQRMARLPWLRAAYLPDWLREALLRSLDRPTLQRARGALRCVLLTAMLPERGHFLLELAEADGGLLAELFRVLTRRLRKQAPIDHPLRDRVFRKWIRDPLGVRLPLALAQPWARFVARTSAAAAEPPSVWSTAFALLLLAFIGLLLAIIDRPPSF